MRLLFGSVKQDAWLRAWILSLQSLGRTADKYVKKITLLTPQVNITDEASPFCSLSTWSLTNKLQISQFWPFRSWPSACTRKSHQHPSWLGTSSCWRHSLTCGGWRREGGGQDLTYGAAAEAEYQRWYQRWSCKWKKATESWHVPSTISETLRQCDRESYPSLHQLLKLSCTLPVPAAEYERTISHLQTLKS